MKVPASITNSEPARATRKFDWNSWMVGSLDEGKIRNRDQYTHKTAPIAAAPIEKAEMGCGIGGMKIRKRPISIANAPKIMNVVFLTDLGSMEHYCPNRHRGE